MKRTWTIIGVADVARSSKWYQALFGQPETRPAHDYFGTIEDTDGTMLNASGHPNPFFIVAGTDARLHRPPVADPPNR